MAHVGHVEGWVATERRPPSLRSAWFVLLLTVSCVGTYVVSLVLPYYANGLQGSSMEELWALELTEQWPYRTALGAPIGVAGVFAVTVGPFLAAGTLWWSARVLWVYRGLLSPRVRALVVATLLVAISIMAWLPTPLAGRLFNWFMD
ncbi:hypothetical protein ASC64_06820 [Nocardioides sp. Root122]|uniref:hypothetical protein n=1 Tax=Nocardioides TaxID=1839 RepID=UPI00070263A2|nr:MULTISPECIES: hypothetical protein [Nocardioides]KQV69554.1 hypothetical protein ASC64_06820 [Nocardioides sp. Root122]MCK9825810.1 hypothetical protein [Nocardioides cavernae]